MRDHPLGAGCGERTARLCSSPLLLTALHRHKPHVRATHRLADRLAIVAVVFLALAIRCDKRRRHHPHPVSKPLELARPVGVFPGRPPHPPGTPVAARTAPAASRAETCRFSTTFRCSSTPCTAHTFFASPTPR